MILDLGLPDVDGIEVIWGLRGWSRAPVIVLSGRTGSGDKINALDAGADDYVTKPFAMEELLARLRAALRRDDPAPAPVRVTIGRCEIDLAAHTALDEGTPVRLTPTQWRLLEILLRHPGQLAALHADWGLRENAVEEMLRHEGPVLTSAFRFTTGPVKIAGTSTFFQPSSARV